MLNCQVLSQLLRLLPTDAAKDESILTAQERHLPCVGYNQNTFIVLARMPQRFRWNYLGSFVNQETVPDEWLQCIITVTGTPFLTKK